MSVRFFISLGESLTQTIGSLPTRQGAIAIL